MLYKNNKKKILTKQHNKRQHQIERNTLVINIMIIDCFIIAIIIVIFCCYILCFALYLLFFFFFFFLFCFFFFVFFFFFYYFFFFFFFFQAEDGIRDVAVTGVQTCALPIWLDEKRQRTAQSGPRASGASESSISKTPRTFCQPVGRYAGAAGPVRGQMNREGARSEERRVGKECRSGGAAEHEKKKKEREETQ